MQRLITQFTRQRQLQRLRSPPHQEAEDLLVAEFARDLMRCLVGAQNPNVDRPPLRRSRFGNHSSETLIRIDAGSASRCRRTRLQIAQRGSHQQIRRAPALHQIPRDLLPLSSPSTAPASIRGRYRACRYPRPAPAGIPQFPPMTRNAAASVHRHRARGPNQGPPPTNSFSRSSIPNRAAACASTRAPRSIRKFSRPARVIQNAETAGPPVAARVDIGSRAQ